MLYGCCFKKTSACPFVDASLPHIVLTYQPPSSFHLLLVTSTTPNNGIEDSIEDSL